MSPSDVFVVRYPDGKIAYFQRHKRRGVASSLTYLLRDEFTTDDDAPITSPRTCEPGPGTLTITDTGNNLSVSSGKLVISGSVGGGNPGVWGGAITIQNGTSLFVEMMAQNNAAEYIDVGWDSNQSGALVNYVRLRPQVQDVLVAETINYTGFTRGQYHKFLLIHRGTAGMFFLSNKSGSTTWELMYARSDNTSTQVYPAITTATAGTNRFIERLHVFNLSAPFDTDYGIATNRVASPAVNETTTSEANALIEMTWTAVTGETWEVMVRRTDDNNCWIVRGDQAGSTIKLIEKNAGVETERSSAAQTWTNTTAYRLVVIQDGNTIRTYVANVAKNSYTSASFNNTATGVKTNKAGSNLVAYPRTLSGAALTELQRWTS